MNILDSYNCDERQLKELLERHIMVGDRISLPDGVYTNTIDGEAAVVINGMFIAELEIYDEYGESKYE